MNEPFVSAFVGYKLGGHAPGHTSDEEMVRAAHHLLLGHGLAVPLIRSNVSDSRVGIVLNLHLHQPASDSEVDRKAAQISDGLLWRWYMNPLTGYEYPQDVIEAMPLPMDVVHGEICKSSPLRWIFWTSTTTPGRLSQLPAHPRTSAA